MSYHARSLLLAFLLAAAMAVAAAAAPRVTLQKDLAYGDTDPALIYDFAAPPEGQGPFPFVLCIHAGGWQLGDKKSYRDILKDLAGRGYAAATVNYRLAPQHKWPAQLEDVKRAIRYFRENAQKLDIDPARFGVVGDDAGAHLGLMLALTAAETEADTPLAQSHKVQAAVNFFAPLDLREWQIASSWAETKIRIAFFKSSDQVVADFLGSSDRAAPIYAEVSPMTHVTAGAPPILTFIGTEDPLVPVAHAEKFHAALEQAGVTEDLVIVEGRGHDREDINHDEKAFARMYAFFDEHLK